MKPEEKPRLLLVSCCAPCSLHIIDELRNDFDLCIFFYNPNIYPRAEYEVRKDDIERYVRQLGLPFVEQPYDHGRWQYMTEGFEDAPERGLRCKLCFSLRIENACRWASEHGIEMFTTTFAISPYKDKESVFRVCYNFAGEYGLTFLERDFRKNDGFKKTMQMSKQNDLYLQNYCGCEYSQKIARQGYSWNANNGEDIVTNLSE